MIRLVQWLAVMRKEVVQISQDRRVLGVLVIAPFIQLLVFGFAVDFEVDRVGTIVVDQDGTSVSREHVGHLLADGTLSRTGALDTPAEALDALDDGQAAAAIVLPKGLHRDLLRGRPAEVQVILDGSDPTRANVAANAVGRYFGEVGSDLARQRIQREAAAGRAVRPPGSVRVVPRVYFNPTLETAPFMVPGIAAMLLVMVTTLTTAMGIAREREIGTLEQVLVTPIPPWVLLAGKIAPYVVIGLFDVTVALAAGSWVFGMPIRGSLLVLVVATIPYLLSTLGAGLLISTVSGNQQQAFLGGFLIIIPSVLLSGNMTPIESMPGWMQPITYLNPLRYFIEVLRGNLIRGAGFQELWPQIAALTVFGVVLFTVAVLRFRKRLG